MIITEVQAENVLKYKHLSLENLPATGVVAISGPNESGKSSIGETICFALFGRTFSLGPDQLHKIVHWGEALIAAAFLGIAAVTASLLGHFGSFQWEPSSWQGSTVTLVLALALLGVVIGLFAYLHFRMRKFATGRVLSRIKKHFSAGIEGERLSQAFVHNTRPWHSLFRKTPVGWNSRCHKRLQQVIAEANQYVQTLNDTFTDPSGDLSPETIPPAPSPAVAKAVSRVAEPDTVAGADESKQHPA